MIKDVEMFKTLSIINYLPDPPYLTVVTVNLKNCG